MGADVVDRGRPGLGVVPLGPVVLDLDEERLVAVDDVVAVLGPGGGGVLVPGGAVLVVAGLLGGEPVLVVGEVGRVALAAVAEVAADEDDGVVAGVLVEGGAGVADVLEGPVPALGRGEPGVLLEGERVVAAGLGGVERAQALGEVGADRGEGRLLLAVAAEEHERGGAAAEREGGDDPGHDDQGEPGLARPIGGGLGRGQGRLGGEHVGGVGRRFPAQAPVGPARSLVVGSRIGGHGASHLPGLGDSTVRILRGRPPLTPLRRGPRRRAAPAAPRRRPIRRRSARRRSAAAVRRGRRRARR